MSKKRKTRVTEPENTPDAAPESQEANRVESADRDQLKSSNEHCSHCDDDDLDWTEILTGRPEDDDDYLLLW